MTSLQEKKSLIIYNKLDQPRAIQFSFSICIVIYIFNTSKCELFVSFTKRHSNKKKMVRRIRNNEVIKTLATAQ